MRNLLRAAVLLTAAIVVTGCTVTLPGLFGAAPVTLTFSGNIGADLSADLPAIQSYVGAVKAGAAADAATAEQAVCPLVQKAQAWITDPNNAATANALLAVALQSSTAAAKQVHNVGDGLAYAANACDAGAAADWKAVVVIGYDAAMAVINGINAKSGGG